jgi:O-antigen ligase
MNKDKNNVNEEAFLGPLNNLVLGVSFITLFFNIKSSDPFNTPKLVMLVLIASLLMSRVTKSFKRTSLNISKIYRLFALLSIFFLASGLFALFTSDSLFLALLGDTQRRNGFLAYLSLTILAFSTSQIINFKNGINVFKVAILTGLIFSLYGLIQISGRDFVSWDNPYNSVIGTVGNPNFASAMMAIFTVIAFTTLLIKNISNYYKIISVICILMSIAAIVASNSRQGLVSLTFAMLFFFTIYVYFIRKKLGLIVMVISAIAGALAIFGMLQKGPLTGLLYKSSVSVRGYYWNAAIEMFKSHPLTGVGFDSYGYYFKELRSIEYPLRYGFDLTSSNAHNTFLQLFATGGFFLGVSYLALVISTLLVGLKLVRKSNPNERLISLGLLSAWIAFQAQSVISIDNIGISVWGWFLTGAIFGLAAKKEIEENSENLQKSDLRKQNQITLMPYLVSIVVLIPSLILSVSLMRVESNTFMARNVADNFAAQADKNSAFSQELLALLDKHANYVASNPISDPNYKIQIAYNLFNTGKRVEAYKIVNNLVKENPRNLYALEAEALLSSELNNPAVAISTRNMISKFDPWNAKNYLQLMLLYKESGDLVNAQVMKDKILSFAANTNEGKIASEEFAKPIE